MRVDMYLNNIYRNRTCFLTVLDFELFPNRELDREW